MDKKEEEDRFTYNPCVHVMKYFSIKKPLFGDFSLSLSLSLSLVTEISVVRRDFFHSLPLVLSLVTEILSRAEAGGKVLQFLSLSLSLSLSQQKFSSRGEISFSLYPKPLFLKTERRTSPSFLASPRDGNYFCHKVTTRGISPLSFFFSCLSRSLHDVGYSGYVSKSYNKGRIYELISMRMT